MPNTSSSASAAQNTVSSTPPISRTSKQPSASLRCWCNFWRRRPNSKFVAEAREQIILLNQRKIEEGAARCDDNVLLAVECIGYRRSVNRRAGAEVPQFFSRARVESDEVAFHVTGENEPACRRKDARPGSRDIFELPFDLPRQRIERAQGAPRPFIRRLEIDAADVGMTGMKGLGNSYKQIALLADGNIKQARLSAKRRRHPIRSAGRGRAHDRTVLALRRRGQQPGPPIRADLAGPGDAAVRFRQQKVSGGAIQQIEEPVAIRECQQLARASVEIQINEHGNFRGIPVMRVGWSELEMPFQFSTVGVERDHAIAVKIVARLLPNIVLRRGISPAPVNQIQIWIKRAGHPCGRTASRPGIARPRLIPGL